MELISFGLAALAVALMARLLAPYVIEERRWQQQKVELDLTGERRASTREAA